MQGKPPLSEGLRPVVVGEPIKADEENLLRQVASRIIDLPRSITDSMGVRQAPYVAPPGMQIIEVTHITHTGLSFDMKDYGVCLGKYVSFDTEEDWHYKYDDTVLSYVPDDNKVEEDEKRYIFIGFLDQSKAAVPRQRYFGMPYGSKTCGELTRPLVVVDGGTPITCSLAEDHPGCGVVFDVWPLPVWNPADKWMFNESKWDLDGCDGTYKLKAIDLRKGVPEPAKYATGLFVPRVSSEYGVLLECVTLDCESPGGCYFCEAPA